MDPKFEHADLETRYTQSRFIRFPAGAVNATSLFALETWNPRFLVGYSKFVMLPIENAHPTFGAFISFSISAMIFWCLRILASNTVEGIA